MTLFALSFGRCKDAYFMFVSTIKGKNMRYSPLLVTILIFLIVRPVVDALFALPFPVDPLRYLILGCALYAIRDRRALFISALILAVGDMVLRSLYEMDQSTLLLNMSHGLGFAAMVLVAFGVSADVFKSGEATGDIVVGAVCIYFMIGMIWTFLYYWLEVIAPGSILTHGSVLSTHHRDERFTDLLYLSVGALSSVGFLTNVSTTPLLGQLGVVEAIGGQLYLAVLIARLVGSHASAASVSQAPHSQKNSDGLG